MLQRVGGGRPKLLIAFPPPQKNIFLSYQNIE